MPLSLSRNLEWNMFNYSSENKIDLNVSVKYIGLPHLSFPGSASLIAIQQCPEYLNKVLITYISESSISVTLLITLSVSPSLSFYLLSVPYPALLYWNQIYMITKNPTAITVLFKCTYTLLNHAPLLSLNPLLLTAHIMRESNLYHPPMSYLTASATFLISPLRFSLNLNNHRVSTSAETMTASVLFVRSGASHQILTTCPAGEALSRRFVVATRQREWGNWVGRAGVFCLKGGL